MIATLDQVLPPVSGVQEFQSVERRRGAPKAIRCLLPVWGMRYITQFLQVSLPTLLAPGNLPSLAQALPCKFIFLTDTDGASILRTHPATNYLKSICEVEIEIIDDLITGDNYSTTITLAYARAVRAADAAMLDTCFFFLISDYVIADGSLANVLARMQAGCSGVLAGNFQVVEEAAKEELFNTFDSGAPEIVILARDLMGWAIKYLHPMTIANTVNFPVCFSTHSNRLFWRVDENTLIGRFYLMHMICIRPEVRDFAIGSSCDYSFIPEMCPSDNVHVMTDSDDYFVVEMQGWSHESSFVRLGAVDHAELEESLAEWTTVRHRKNAHFPVTFHADELSAAVADLIAESLKYIEVIEAQLPPAQPHREHPYWLGAIAAHRREILKNRKKKNALEGTSDVIDESLTTSARYHDFLYYCRDLIFGYSKKVKIWHPRCPDYRMIRGLARRYLKKRSHGRWLILSSAPSIFRHWWHLEGTIDSLDFHMLREMEFVQYMRMKDKYDGCVLALNHLELQHLHELLKWIVPLLPFGGCVLIFMTNGHGLTLGRRFNRDMLREVGGFFDPNLSIDDVKFVSAGWSTWAVVRGMRRLFELTKQSPAYLPITILPICALLLVNLIVNSFGRRVGPRPANNGLCSSAGIVMHVTGQKYGEHEFTVENELEIAGRRFKENQPSPAAVYRIESV